MRTTELPSSGDAFGSHARGRQECEICHGTDYNFHMAWTIWQEPTLQECGFWKATSRKGYDRVRDSCSEAGYKSLSDLHSSKWKDKA